MRDLTISEVVSLHPRLIAQAGGSAGIRDVGLLESALAQPRATFGSEDLHPTVLEKAAALEFALVANHAFVDGNKRIRHAAMEVFLILNGYQVDAPIGEQEKLILRIASGESNREELASWLVTRTVPR